MNAKLIAATCCWLLATAAPAHAGNPAAGREKSQVCAACHGPDGNSPSPDFPKIAGQHYDYLVKVLIHYKTGVRKNPVMAPIVEKLSRRDIEDLAAFYSSQRGLTTKY
jgi:cytochrome c553